jgi:DNA-binding response OmpR family regulator
MVLRFAPEPSFIALLVHGRPDHRETYAATLKLAGFAVNQGTSGMQAIERAASLLPDVIILDLELDDFDGWQVCRLLKSGTGTAAIPLVVLVPPRVADGMQRAQDAGCDAALAKPVTPETLLAAIRLVLGRPSLPLERRTPPPHRFH